MKTVLSLIFLIILISCAWSGYKKGLILGILSLLAFVASVYGANLLASTYAGEVVDALRPFASGFVEVNIVDKSVRPAMGMDDANLSVSDYFSQNPGKEEKYCLLTYEYMGIHPSTSEQLAEEAMDYAAKNGVDVTDAVVEVLCQRVSFIGGFVLLFTMLLIALTALINIPNLSFKIPNMDLFNDVGGTVMGLLQGIGLCLVIGWAMKFLGLVFPQEELADAFLVSWFMDRTILVRFLGI